MLYNFRGGGRITIYNRDFSARNRLKNFRKEVYFSLSCLLLGV